MHIQGPFAINTTVVLTITKNASTILKLNMFRTFGFLKPMQVLHCELNMKEIMTKVFSDFHVWFFRYLIPMNITFYKSL